MNFRYFVDCAESEFNRYITPTQKMNKAASELTKLIINNNAICYAGFPLGVLILQMD